MATEALREMALVDPWPTVAYPGGQLTPRASATFQAGIALARSSRLG
jgi:hypothetical protein